jgi:superfamily I DNA and/or RNA helicase
MHSAISAFPAKHFYGGMLRDADNVTALVPPAGYNWPQTSSGILPVSFVPVSMPDTPRLLSVAWHPPRCCRQVVDGKEMASTDGTSKTNRKEADAVFDILKAVLDAGDVLASDVGIVTPYKGQVELLRKMIEESAIGMFTSQPERNRIYTHVCWRGCLTRLSSPQLVWK